MIYLTASDFYSYYQPEECKLRIYLKHKGVKEAEASAYEKVLERLGKQHEENHLKTLGDYADISEGLDDERIRKTNELIKNQRSVIYQPLFKARTKINNVECEIIGQPDFLIFEDEGYVIRDSKISRRINDKDHPEIFRQLEIYGWLYEQTVNQPPIMLQVHSGTDEIIEIHYDKGKKALDSLAEILSFKLLPSEPYNPVGWSKCSICGFFDYCWLRAEKAQDAAILSPVDKGLAIAFRSKNIMTINDILEHFNEESLARFERPRGEKMQKVGKNAEKILHMARAIISGNENLLQNPDIPDHPNYVMFDIEGLPPHLKHDEKIYLWGLQVFGDKPSNYEAALADLGKDGDKKGWEEFLSICESIFDDNGHIPFVHWSSYEKSRLSSYIKRYGDNRGIAERIIKNLFDLHAVLRKSIVMPLPSFSLKVVEKYVGFKRKLEEYGGDWAIAKYFEAIETEDELKRKEVIGEIIEYNKEDLEATWAVLTWLKGKRI